LIFAYNSDRME